ncbi:Tm-1-like ATP-binding domain-containing protein [[Clostridium] scindens]|uniref:Tm-1-like ATP-binding domain-containing protein n=1 Tax=Clostridium scindens (strain JCM 10418 / VPI 12708) TaxID=29347 RepID=UPI003AB4351F
MTTISIIESCDTKYKEAEFFSNFIKKEDLNTLVLNTATGPDPSYNYDISREEIAEAYGTSWSEMEPKSKGEKIDFMKDAVADYVEKLYLEGKIDGIISVGGLQNTVMAANAMQRLPIGFPKVIATTVASGTRKFDLVVGDKDITVMPAICDFTGLNIVTRQVISNACACCVGMVKCAGKVLKKGDKPVVAVTLMGVTNNGAVEAVEELERVGLEVIGFHATGVGGATMENMAASGLVDGILDLTLHELTSEYFGGGFSYGPRSSIRLVESVEKKVPLVISLGGLDFVDFSTNELPGRMDERKYMLHNANTAHIKILPDEAEALGKILVERLSKVTYPIKLLIPTKGMRHNTQEGQELYSPESDSVLIQTIINNVNDNVEVIVIPHNLDTKEFGIKAAHYMIDEMKQRGKLSQDFSY